MLQQWSDDCRLTCCNAALEAEGCAAVSKQGLSVCWACCFSISQYALCEARRVDIAVQISDAESQYVRRSDCDTLFIVANYQPDKKDPSVAVNDEHALMRFEFLEAIVRLAVAKYGKVTFC